jgi:hypothetical protein
VTVLWKSRQDQNQYLTFEAGSGGVNAQEPFLLSTFCFPNFAFAVAAKIRKIFSPAGRAGMLWDCQTPD